MMTSQASFGEGMGGGGGGGVAAPRASEPYDEAAALRESLRVSHDGGMPDVSAVVVRVAQVRERKLPGGIGAPRGVEVEYATDLFIQAPGEELMVARSWRSFREFRQLLMSIGSEIQPSQTLGRPTLPSKEKDLCVLSTHLLDLLAPVFSLVFLAQRAVGAADQDGKPGAADAAQHAGQPPPAAGEVPLPRPVTCPDE